MTSPAAILADSTTLEALAMRELRAGVNYATAGLFDDAIACYRRGLDATANAPVRLVAELHFKLGNAGMLKNDLDLAAYNFKAALRLVPDMTPCWCNLGNVHQRWQRPQDAIVFYMQALALDPGHWPTRTNLAQALIATKQYAIARALLMELAAERPQDANIHKDIGRLHVEFDEMDQAIGCFARALAIDPLDADALYWLGGTQQKNGDHAAAEVSYARAAQLQPLIRRDAEISPAAFAVLALFAPFAGNTPTEYLLTGPTYATNMLALFPGRADDLDTMRRHGDVVVNLICDADQAQSLFPLAAELIDGLNRPTVNHPHKVARTTRENVALLLQDIPRCHVPRTLRLIPHVSWDTALDAAASFAAPMLARPAGTHGGDDFEKFDNACDAATFIGHNADAEHYLIEYIDYRSVDGYFRKYRFIFVGNDILPYHLAIGDDWKLHHDSTDMVDHAWMQQEEAAFLDDPSIVFGAAQQDVLHAIRRTIDLEYAGIDCGLDAVGNVVVFEVNASMLVHQRNENFRYKEPYVERIRAAFDALLQKMATGSNGERCRRRDHISAAAILTSPEARVAYAASVVTMTRQAAIAPITRLNFYFTPR